MRRSVALLSSRASPPIVDARKYLTIPLRTTYDTLCSAAGAFYSHLTSTSEREQFVKLANEGTINPMFIGIPHAMALYYDLASERSSSAALFKQHAFDVQDFGRGVSGALANYHEMQAECMDEVNKQLGENQDLNTESLLKMLSDFQAIQKQSFGNFDKVDDSMDPPPPKSILGMVNQCKETAQNDSDSTYAQLQRMTTPQYFQNSLVDIIVHPILVMGMRGFKDVITETEISEVTLLSARAASIPPTPITAPEELEKLSPKEMQRNDDILNGIYTEQDENGDIIEKDLPVAAQLEVLYVLKVNERAKDNDTKDDEDKVVVEEGETEVDDKTKESISSMAETPASFASSFQKKNDEKPLLPPRKYACLAVFEGWLSGSPTGKLEWKLAFQENAQ